MQGKELYPAEGRAQRRGDGHTGGMAQRGGDTGTFLLHGPELPLLPDLLQDLLMERPLLLGQRPQPPLRCLWDAQMGPQVVAMARGWHPQGGDGTCGTHQHCHASRWPGAGTHLLQGGPGADEVEYELVSILLHPGGDVSIHLGREGGQCWAGGWQDGG